MLNFRRERKLIERIGRPILAMDEAGRGPLAGPVSVGGVLLDKKSFSRSELFRDGWWRKVNDSKKVSAKRRAELAKIISATFPSCAILVSAVFIDQNGIAAAIRAAAEKVFLNLAIGNPLVLADGRERFLEFDEVDQRNFIGGDGIFFSIACASILAKVKRDEYMDEMAKKWPEYQFEKHKGYGTAKHLEVLADRGPCPLHRFSYAPLKNRASRKSFFLSKL